MPNTIEAYINGKPLNPNRDLPYRSLAQAQAEGLTSSNRLWVRTDGQNTPISAEQISYGNSNVKSELDTIGFKELTSLSVPSTATIDYNGCKQIGNLVLIDLLITTTGTMSSANRIVWNLPETASQDNFQFWGTEVKAYPNFSTTPLGFRVYNAYQNGGIYPNVSINAGQYHIYGMYVAQ